MRLRSGNVKLLQHSAVKTQGLTGKIRVGNNATIQTCRSYRFFFVWLIKNKIKKQELARNSKRCGRHHVTNACMQCYRVLAGKRAAYFRVFELPKSIRTFGRWLCGKYKITRLFKLAYWLLIYYFVVRHIFVPHLRDTSRIHIYMCPPRERFRHILPVILEGRRWKIPYHVMVTVGVNGRAGPVAGSDIGSEPAVRSLFGAYRSIIRTSKPAKSRSAATTAQPGRGGRGGWAKLMLSERLTINAKVTSKYMGPTRGSGQLCILIPLLPRAKYI